MKSKTFWFAALIAAAVTAGGCESTYVDRDVHRHGRRPDGASHRALHERQEDRRDDFRDRQEDRHEDWHEDWHDRR